MYRCGLLLHTYELTVLLSDYGWVGVCNAWVCVCMGFVMRGCFDSCVGVMEMCVLVFTVFCIVCTVFFGIVSSMYIYFYFFCLH